MNIDEHWTFQCLLSCVFPTCLVFDCFAAVHQSPFWFVKGRRVRKLLLLWCILYSYHVLPRSDVHFAASRPFFPTCQVRVVRFYVSCPAFRLPSASRRTSTASSQSQWSPPDPNSNLWIKVLPQKFLVTETCEMKSWGLRVCRVSWDISSGQASWLSCGNAQCNLESCSGKWSAGKIKS